MKSLLTIVVLLLFSAPAYSAGDQPPVFLSHIWIALDQVTYDAMRDSTKLAALGAVKEQKVVAGSQKWSGFYWTARQTTLEFFGADALPGETELGDSGVGLAVESQGGVVAVAERLRTVFGHQVEIDKQVRTMATGDVPWYTSTHLNKADTTAVWVMEVDPAYLAARHPETPISEPLSRERYNAWDYRPDQTFDNVVGLTLSLNQEMTAQLATELKLFGWSVHRTGRGFSAVGPEVQLTVVPAGARAGVQQIKLRLCRFVAKQTIPLGNAQLRLAGNTGQLVFWK